MRLFLFLVCGGLGVSGLCGAEAGRAPDAAAMSTTNLIITCTNGAEVFQQTGIAIYRGDVRVLETQMYLECALLTIYSDTNSATPVRESGLTNLNTRISTIVAETNLLVMLRDATIIGDRAVYTASNDMVVVTGDPVILETERSYTFCTNFVVYRATGQGYVLGDVFQSFLGPPGSGGKEASTSLGIQRQRKPPASTPPATKPGKEAKPEKGGKQ